MKLECLFTIKIEFKFLKIEKRPSLQPHLDLLNECTVGDTFNWGFVYLLPLALACLSCFYMLVEEIKLRVMMG